MLADDELRAALTTRLPDLEPDVERDLGRVLDRAAFRARRRRAAYVVGLVAAVVATVLVVGHDWQRQAREPEPVKDVSVTAQALTAKRGMYHDPAPLPPGRYRAEFLGPAATFPGPGVELDIPAGWGQDDLYAFATGPGDRAATRRIDLFADIQRIVFDSCGNRVLEPGPGAHNLATTLATTLASAAATDVTGPTPVTLGGYSGFRLRLEDVQGSGPTGPCAEGTVLREGFPGYLCVAGLARWTDLVWVLDVGDSRVVISASHGPHVSPASEDELVRIVESASFVLP